MRAELRRPDTAGLPRGAFRAMGTVVSVRPGATGPGAGAGADADTDAALVAVADVFRRWEATCSLFVADSELSRVGRGELSLLDAGTDVRRAYAIALEWRLRTRGAFTPHRGDGRIDLDGVVKALAVAESGAVLDRAGATGWAIDAGGDVLVAHGPGPVWQVGVVDPDERGALLGGIPLGGELGDTGPGGRRALATSGSAERGDHIWTRPGEGPSPFRQVSVAADDIVTADVLATAIVAGGEAALDECADRFDIDVLAVRRDGALLATPGWPRARPTG
ncbi:FAD:protein FMN transferase [Agromyces sp. MMS24-JH15]|uniref:FAD:protein FMN transferase n=1 Tax=Agromyces sp. MMS24-JH15 TaxID=3243765 RepID=UPI003749BAA3